ncbi:MAG: class I SAM-dependent methyltransferase [Caldilineales bacterium]|nr:class I SAM-dependent methyltransferase [Caldilineales bacterium]MDW8316688.1 methyltransferase domain-containing protein [Anaerolineae bacterium]
MQDLSCWLDVLGCPECRGPLRLEATDRLACPTCGLDYPVVDQIPRLATAEVRRRLDAFADEYRRRRLAEGWQPLSEADLLGLPEKEPPSPFPLYWPLRRETWQIVRGRLITAGPPPEAGPVADLGAGVGWLSYRLAQAGYRVVAVDASVDNAFGLAAARAYQAVAPFLAVQGDLERPPLRRGALSLVLFNASLHYASDLVGTLRAAAAALQPGGLLMVLDTPIAERPRRGTGHGDRHLGRRELDEALAAAGLTAQWVEIYRGPRWRLHQAVARLRGNDLFDFPLVMADKPRSP